MFNSNLYLTTILLGLWERYYEFHYIDIEIEAEKACDSPTVVDLKH